MTDSLCELRECLLTFISTEYLHQSKSVFLWTTRGTRVCTVTTRSTILLQQYVPGSFSFSIATTVVLAGNQLFFSKFVLDIYTAYCNYIWFLSDPMYKLQKIILFQQLLYLFSFKIEHNISFLSSITTYNSQRNKAKVATIAINRRNVGSVRRQQRHLLRNNDLRASGSRNNNSNSNKQQEQPENNGSSTMTTTKTSS